MGAGHVHLHLLEHARQFAELNSRLLLIDPGDFWYSGMATGMLGGMYTCADYRLDAGKLAESRGAGYLRAEVVRVDSIGRRVCLSDDRELDYDFLSLNVGSRIGEGIAGIEGDRSVWPVKPVQNLWRLRRHLEKRFGAGESPRLAVVGGGASGCEVAANLLALAKYYRQQPDIVLVTGGRRLLPQAPEGASLWLEGKLRRRGLVVHKEGRVLRRRAGELILEDGSTVAADEVVLATGLEANTLVHHTGLPVHPRAGLRVADTLQSIADERVFAAGDCAAMENFCLPKLGVFGVRQAEFIRHNLLASLSGGPLRSYRPQRRYLSILNLGDGTALAMRGSRWWNGRSSLWLKNHLDRRFLEHYRRLSP